MKPLTSKFLAILSTVLFSGHAAYAYQRAFLPLPSIHQAIKGPIILTRAGRAEKMSLLTREQVKKINSFFSDESLQENKEALANDPDMRQIDRAHSIDDDSSAELIAVRNAVEFYLRNVAGLTSMNGLGDNVGSFLGDAKMWDYYGKAVTTQYFLEWLKKFGMIVNFDAKRIHKMGNPFWDAAMLVHTKSQSGWVLDAWVFNRVKIMDLDYAAQFYKHTGPTSGRDHFQM